MKSYLVNPLLPQNRYLFMEIYKTQVKKSHRFPTARLVQDHMIYSLMHPYYQVESTSTEYRPEMRRGTHTLRVNSKHETLKPK